MKTSQKRLLIIGFNFPEPSSSAAGSRMMQLIDLFLSNEWKITFLTSAKETEHSEKLEKLGISTGNIYPNDEKANRIFTELQPQIVLFDRFMIEEQFGWRVAESCPDALRILDTEDLHFLRKARREALKQNKPIDLQSVLAKREIASILRSDLTLMISDVEMELLKNTFRIDENLLWYSPFLFSKISENAFDSFPTFEERKNMIFIGNFLHAPNYDAVLYLKNEIWPLIHQKDPSIKMEIYGAYPPQKLKQLENKQQNFLIKGRAENLENTFQNARILIAPLRFGAGLKGKFFDAMQNGTPSITTDIGLEGICEKSDFNGMVKNTPEEIANSAFELYQDIDKWKNAQIKGMQIINSRFEKTKFENGFLEKITELIKDVESHRRENFMGQLLMHHRQQSTKYLSRWIELKNKTL